MRSFVFRKGRYGVPYEEYGKKFYPRYCSGGGYVLSKDVVEKMHEKFDQIPAIRIDDVFIAELALLSGVDPFHDTRFNMYVSSCNFFSRLIVHHPVKSRECMEKIYKGYLKYYPGDRDNPC